MAMVQTVGKAGKNFQKSLTFVAKTMGIGLLLWLFVMILTSTIQIITGIDFVTIEFTSIHWWWEVTSWYCAIEIPEFLGGGCALSLPEGVWHKDVTVTTLDVDVATWIVVGAIDLILQVLHTLALVIGMVIVWLINAFIFGEDSQGNVLNPLSLFQVLKLIPFIQDVVAGVHGVDESIIVSLDNLLTAIDDLFYNIANGLFTGIAGIWHNIAEGILGKRSSG